MLTAKMSQNFKYSSIQLFTGNLLISIISVKLINFESTRISTQKILDLDLQLEMLTQNGVK